MAGTFRRLLREEQQTALKTHRYFVSGSSDPCPHGNDRMRRVPRGRYFARPLPNPFSHNLGRNELFSACLVALRSSAFEAVVGPAAATTTCRPSGAEACAPESPDADPGSCTHSDSATRLPASGSARGTRRRSGCCNGAMPRGRSRARLSSGTSLRRARSHTASSGR